MIFYQFGNIDDFCESELKYVFNELSENQKKYIIAKKEQKKRQSLSARALLQRLLSENFENLSINKLIFNDNGAPILEGDKSLYVSLSHSENMVAAAVSDLPVGIDVEKIREISQKTASKVCSADEVSFVLVGDRADFFRVWTLKEAYVKAIGTDFCGMKNKSFVKNGEIITQDGAFKIEQGQICEYVWSIYYCIKE